MKISLNHSKLAEIRKMLKDAKHKQEDVDILMDYRDSVFVESVTVKVRGTDTAFILPFTALFIDKNAKSGKDEEYEYENRE